VYLKVTAILLCGAVSLSSKTAEESASFVVKNKIRLRQKVMPKGQNLSANLKQRFFIFSLLIVQSSVVTLFTIRFNIQQFYVLPTQFIYVFCVDLRTNSDYFTVQH
jgi:hypothetical protein